METFKYVIENVCSEIFLFIIMFLYENRPFNNKTLENYELAKNCYGENRKLSKSPNLTKSNRLIASPNLQSKFSPSLAISRSPIFKKNALSDLSGKNKTDHLLSKLTKKSTQPDSRNILMKYAAKGGGQENENFGNLQSSNKAKTEPDEFKNVPIRKNWNNLRNLEEVKKNNIVTSVKEYSDLPIEPAVKYTSESRPEDQNLAELLNKVNIKNEDSDEEESDQVKFEGYLYKITVSKKLKKLWFKLLHKDLYCKKFLNFRLQRP